MAETCTFCGYEIPRGTGKAVVMKDSAVHKFCSSKCEKNFLVLRRNPLRTPWTRHYLRFKGKLTKTEEENIAKMASDEAAKKEASKKAAPKPVGTQAPAASAPAAPKK